MEDGARPCLSVSVGEPLLLQPAVNVAASSQGAIPLWCQKPVNSFQLDIHTMAAGSPIV